MSRPQTLIKKIVFFFTVRFLFKLKRKPRFSRAKFWEKGNHIFFSAIRNGVLGGNRERKHGFLQKLVLPELYKKQFNIRLYD